MPCGATQDGRVMVERSDRVWSTGEGNGKPLQYSCLENPMNSMKRQKDRTLRDDLPRLVGVQYATGEEWRNSSIKNEEAESKQELILAWKIPWTEMPGELQSIVSQRVRHDWSKLPCMHGQESLRRDGEAFIVNKSLKCHTWVQSQKWQNDLCSFPKQTTQYHSNPNLCPNH